MIKKNVIKKIKKNDKLVAVLTAFTLLTGSYVVNEEFGKVALAINLDNSKIEVTVKKGTVRSVLEQKGITLGEYDRVEPGLNSLVHAGQEITIYRAKDVVIVDGEKTETRKTTYTKVEDVLAELNIQLGEYDRVEPSKDKEIKDVDTIKIIRVEKNTVVEKEEIAYQTIKENDSSKYTGEQTVKTEGVNGEKEVTKEIVKENGKVVSTTNLSEKVLKEATNKVVLVGTKYNPAGEFVPGEAPANMSGRQITVSAVSYSLGRGRDGMWGRGASGMALGPGVKAIAVDPRVIPLGTKVYVPGYGVAVAADTGGAIKGNTIDVFMSRYQDSVNWGRKTVTITIL